MFPLSRRSRAAARGCGRPRRLHLERLESRCLLAAIVMSDWEQLLVELINRARLDPAAEASRYGIDLNQGLAPGTISPLPKQPLAPHQALVDVAGAHSQDMLDRDFFDHTNPDGQSPFDRMTAAGYNFTTAGENIAWGGTTGTLNKDAAVYQRHEGLFKSPGHRTNILGTGYREIGTGVRFGVFTSGGVNWNASMVTEVFGARSGNPFLTGVVYSDTVVSDAFYSLGEGLGDVTITAAASGATFTTQSGPSGGYAIQVPAGVYTVTATGGALGGSLVVSGVMVGAENRKVDFEAASVVLPEPPTISALSSQTTLEDTPLGPIAFTVGDAETPAAALIVQANSSNTALIPAGNILLGGSGASRTLTLAPAANQFGSATITLTVTDSDGLTATGSFLLTVTPVNDPPTLDSIFDPAPLPPDAGPQTLALTGITAGPGESQSLTITATSSNPGLVPDPDVSYDSGSTALLSYTPIPGQTGEAIITVTVADDGGTDNGGVHTVVRTFRVAVPAAGANEPPSFLKGPDQYVFDDSGPQSVAAWATAISAGPAAETGQLPLTFLIASVTNSGILSGPVGVDASGRLTFSPRPNTEGSAVVTLQLQDSGGTENGGSDTSLPQSFTISVTKRHRWHNSLPPYGAVGLPGRGAMDVDADGSLTPTDALLIINYLNAGRPPAIAPTAPIGNGSSQPFYDVDADDYVTPSDALLIINVLNAGQGGPVGEAAFAALAGEAQSTGERSFDELISLLAFDSAEQTIRRRRGL